MPRDGDYRALALSGAPDGRTFRRRAFTTGRSFGITAAAVPGHALRDHRAPEAVLQKENREP
jgi:hypothetical protein